MKIAISATETSLDAPMDDRFGRCPCFVIAEPEGSVHDIVENIHAERGSGAGIQAACLVIERESRLFSPADAVRMPLKPFPPPESGSSPDTRHGPAGNGETTPPVAENLPRQMAPPRQAAGLRPEQEGEWVGERAVAWVADRGGDAAGAWARRKHRETDRFERGLL